MIESIGRYLRQVQQHVEAVSQQEIAELIYLLIEANWRQRQIFIMGNGGSAATASHFACDLGKGCIVPGFPRFRAMALTDNVPLITAWANDTAYDYIFSQQLSGLVHPGDVVIGISGSGNSPNVLNAIRLAQMRSAVTVGISGFDGGRLREMVDLSLHVPSSSMEQVEDVHLILTHLICTTIREQFRERIGDYLSVSKEDGEMYRFAKRLTRSLAVTLCSLVLLEPTRDRAVLSAMNAIRSIDSTPEVGQQFVLRQAPTLSRIALEGEPVVFKQSDPSLALPAEELRLMLNGTLRSGALLPIRINGEIVGVVSLGEMRSWERSPLTEKKLSRGLELIEEWAGWLVAKSAPVMEVNLLKKEAV